MLANQASMLLTRDSFAATVVDRPAVVRDDAGMWRYDGTGIAAVGARDVTLGELVKPRVLGREGEEPEAIILSLSEIIDDARLNWVLQVGTKLDGDDEPLFLVPLAVWQERAAEPVKAWLPEHDASGIDRCLAAAERHWRFAKKALDDAGRDRMRIILLATRMGKSRRDVGETLGLSSGRVQQLNEDPPAELAAEVDRFIGDAAEIAAGLAAHPSPSHEFPSHHGLGSDRFDELVTDMLALGLLDGTPDGLQVTDGGRSLAESESERRTNSRATRKARPSREQAGDANK